MINHYLDDTLDLTLFLKYKYAKNVYRQKTLLTPQMEQNSWDK